MDLPGHGLPDGRDMDANPESFAASPHGKGWYAQGVLARGSGSISGV